MRAARPGGQHAGDVVGDAAAGDVGRAFERAGFDQLANGLQIAAVHFQELVGEFGR